jgi:hypothetical protein
VVYELPKPPRNAPGTIALDPLELIDRLVLLIPVQSLVEGPPPRIHRHRYHGVLAPHARLHAAVTAYAYPLNRLSPINRVQWD